MEVRYNTKMKTSKKLFSLLLVLVLALSLAPVAFGEFVFSDEQGKLTGEVDATAFVAAENPESSADIRGILFEAGKSVSTNGSSEYAFVAGNTVNFAGTNSNDAFVGGNMVVFSGECGRDLAIAGNAVQISGSVGRDLMAGGRSVAITGSVGGNVTLSAQEITIADSAEIGGRLRYNSSAKITGPSDLLAAAEVYQDNKNQSGDNAAQPESSANQTADSENQTGNTGDNNTQQSSSVVPTVPGKKTSPFLSKLKSKIFTFVGVLLIAYFFLWLTPLWEKLDAKYTGKSFGTFAKAFGIGLAVLAALPLASIILMVSGVGMRPAWVLILVVNAVLLAAPIFLGFFLGSLLWRKALKKDRNYWAELPIGLALWAILTLIPRVGFLVKLITACLGVGVVTLLLGKNKRAAKPAAPVPAPVEAVPNAEEAQNGPTFLPPTNTPDALTPPSEK